MTLTPGRALVIGSGLSGLASAILLAEAGWSVTVLEAHAIPGGLMQRYKRGGRWFDTGFHLVTDGGPAGMVRQVLRRLGVLDAVTFLAPDPDAQFIVRAPGSPVLALPVGITAAGRAAAAHWSDQAVGITRFFSAINDRLAANPWLDHLAAGRADPEPVDSTISVSGMLARCGVTGEAATMLGAASSILAMQAERCPFELYATFAGASFAGSYRIAGGGDGLTKPLLTRLRDLGGRILLKTAATRIVHDGTHASAVIDVHGVTHPAELVITTCHPDAVLKMTGDQGFRPSFRARLAEVPDSAGAVLLAAELSEPATRLGRSHHIMRLADGSDGYLVAPDTWGDAQPPSLEMMVWIDTATTTAWKDSALGKRPAAYAAWKTTQEARLRQAIEAQYPWLTPTIRRTWLATPLTFRDYLGGRDGGAMGLSHDLGHLGDSPLQPRNRLRNLLLTGQSISHPGIQGTLVGACIVIGGVIGRDLRHEMSAT